MNTINNSIENLQRQYQKQSTKTNIDDVVPLYDRSVKKWNGKIWQSRNIKIWCNLTIDQYSAFITANFKIINYDGKNIKWEKYINKINFDKTDVIFYLNDGNHSSNSERYKFRTEDMELMNIDQTIKNIKQKVDNITMSQVNENEKVLNNRIENLAKILLTYKNQIINEINKGFSTMTTEGTLYLIILNSGTLPDITKKLKQAFKINYHPDHYENIFINALITLISNGGTSVTDMTLKTMLDQEPVEAQVAAPVVAPVAAAVAAAVAAVAAAEPPAGGKRSRRKRRKISKKKKIKTRIKKKKTRKRVKTHKR